MQTLLDQEKQTTQDMEGLKEDLLKDEQKLEKTLERLHVDKNRQAGTKCTSTFTHAKCTISWPGGKLSRVLTVACCPQWSLLCPHFAT